MKSFDWECSEPKKPCNNFLTMKTLSDDWPNYFSNCKGLQTSLEPLSFMQCWESACKNIIPTAFLLQSTFLCVSNLHRGTYGEYKHIASEDGVFLQAIRAALTGSNKTGNIWNALEETQNQTLRSDNTASRSWGQLISCFFLPIQFIKSRIFGNVNFYCWVIS